jgi:hypothetical protein
VLEKIASGYAQNSAELRVLEEAGYALCFALTLKHKEFSQYLADLKKPLTKKQEKRLRELGLEK